MDKKKVTIAVVAIIVSWILFFVVKNIETKRQAIKLARVVKPVYSAWIPEWDETRSIESLNGDSGNKLSEILPTWYELDINGKVAEIASENKAEVVETAKNKKIKVTPTLVNTTKAGFDATRVTKFIGNNPISASQKKDSIKTLVKIAQDKGFNGWDLDLEEIAKDDRDKYSDFVKELASALHSSKLTLSITVHAQEEGENWEGTEGQDLKALGMYADKIRVMTYDFHNSESIPGAVTPIEDLEKTINFAKSKVDASKIVIALPTYGYDWTNGKNGVASQFKETQALIDLNKASIFRDLDSQELRAIYPDHTIWYVDATTIERLVQITHAYGVNQISFWHLGGEDPEMWKGLN